MANLKLSRRAMVVGGPAALLLGPALRRSHATTGGGPARFMVLFTPNGLNHLDAGPSGSESDWSLGDYYAQLQPHQDDMLAVSGLQIGGVPYGTNSEGGHVSGGIGCITCTPDEGTGFATGPSVDQVIARGLFEQGIAPALRAPVFSVGASGVSDYAHCFYEAAGEPVPLINDPVVAFDSLFSDLSPEEATELIARKKSVLDVAYGECKAYLPDLPSEGRATLDYHCERIRDLEANLQVFTCTPPDDALAQVSGLDRNDPSNYPALTDFFWEMLEVALLCDLTRVASFSFGETADRFNMPWLDIPLIGQVDTGEQNVRDHHSHTHAGSRETIGMFMDWYATKISELVTRFKQVQPDGTCLFEDTTILLTTEYGSNGPHSNADGANFIIGNAQGALATGRHVDLGNDAANTHAMMVALIHAMGVEGIDQFGHPGGGSGPLDALLA